MELDKSFDIYKKFKIEEPNLRLPKALLKVNMDPSRGELHYIKIFDDDFKRLDHLREKIAAGAELDRKVYRIRNLELSKPTGENFEFLHEIHKVSKANIGVLRDLESELHNHYFIDLVGTVEEVKMAEELILDEILKTYPILTVPVILMPPTVHMFVMKIHVDKVDRLVGKEGCTILAMEAVSGVWLQVDGNPYLGGKEWDRKVRIYGPKGHVIRAASLINSHIYEEWEREYIETEKQTVELFKELTYDEMMDDDVRNRSRDLSDSVSQLMQGEQKMLQIEEDGSGSCETKEHMGELFKKVTPDAIMDNDMEFRFRDVSDSVSELTQVMDKVFEVGEGGFSCFARETEEHGHDEDVEDVEETTCGEASSRQHVY